MSSSRPIGLTPKQFGATNALVTLAAMSFLVWVVLLRAPGLGGLRDGRPFHAIRPAGIEERVSVGLRMNTRP